MHRNHYFMHTTQTSLRFIRDVSKPGRGWFNSQSVTTINKSTKISWTVESLDQDILQKDFIFKYKILTCAHSKDK